jgi:hypothetical protein
VPFSLVGIAPVASAAKPSAAKLLAQLTFVSNQVNAGISPTFKYATTGTPAGSKLYLQRQFGLDHVWTTVEQLNGLDGTATTVGVPQGRYHYRLAVYASSRFVTTSSVALLYSYGPVSLTSLCRAPNVKLQQGNCNSGTVQVGSHVFGYEMIGNYYGIKYPTYNNFLTFPANRCRTLSLTFTLGNSKSPGEVAYVQILQTTLNPQHSSVAQGSPGTLVAQLDRGPWYLQNSSATYGQSIYYDGFASCWSADGE